MGSEWKECLLGDLVELKRGYDLPKKQRIKGSVPIISSSGISDFHADSKVKGPGVVTGRYGTIGEVFYTNKEFWPLNTTLYVKDFKGNDPKFIYYFLKTIPYHLYSDKAAVPGVNRNHLHLAVVKAPACKEEQKKLGQLLEDFDNKIELNRQTNQILEQMAQALFKSWFVDFDPVIDNALAAGNPIPPALAARAESRKSLQGSADNTPQLPEHIRALFPDSFIHHPDRGWIPVGWEVTTFSHIASHVRMNIKSENISDDDIYVGLEHIGRKQIFLANHGVGEKVESNKSGFKQNDLLFGKLRPYFHKVCLAPMDGICSTDILVFRAKEKCFHSFVALNAYTDSFVEYANLRSTGTRMPRASAKDMLAYQLVLPQEKLAEVFENIIQPIWDKGFSSVFSNDELAKLRDTLLPKLISGELRLPDTHPPEPEAQPEEQPEAIAACGQQRFNP